MGGRALPRAAGPRILIAGLLGAALLASCGTPRFKSDASPGAPLVNLEAGPLRLSYLTDVWVYARLARASESDEATASGDAPREEVRVEFHDRDFQRVHFTLDGRSRVYPRVSFTENEVRIPFDDFEPVQTAKVVSFRFDEDPKPYLLDAEARRVLVRFAGALSYHRARLLDH